MYPGPLSILFSSLIQICQNIHFLICLAKLLLTHWIGLADWIGGYGGSCPMPRGPLRPWSSPDKCPSLGDESALSSWPAISERCRGGICLEKHGICEKQTNSITICYRRPQGQGTHKYTCIWTNERQHRYKSRLTLPQQWKIHTEHPISRHNPMRNMYTPRLMKEIAIKTVHNNTWLSVEQISHFNGEMSFSLGCIVSYHFSEWLLHKLFIGFC